METAKKEKVRVLLTRHVFEGHDIGLRTIVNRCRELGIEVIYYPRFKDLNEVVKVAEEEDVGLIGISSSTGAHIYLSEVLISTLKEKGMVMPVIVGGMRIQIRQPHQLLVHQPHQLLIVAHGKP